jgi:small-conductance mechanosensitive channel
MVNETSEILKGFEWLSNINWAALLASITILVVGVLISYITKKLLYRVSIRVMPEKTAYNLARFTYYTLVVIFAISAVSVLGINLTGVVIAGGFLGIILGFALQNITANLVSGLFLYWERPLKPGDLVSINDEYIGYVEDISIMSTRIRGLDGIIIRIPNNTVYTSVIKNLAITPVRRLEFRVGIAYHEDAGKAISVINKLLEKHPLVLAKPKPEVFVEELGDSSVNICVRVWIPSSEWYNVLRELLWLIKKEITSAGIEIPFPQNDVWFRNPLRIVFENSGKKHVVVET